MASWSPPLEHLSERQLYARHRLLARWLRQTPRRRFFARRRIRRRMEEVRAHIVGDG